MTVAVNIHSATKIQAQADHYGDTHWVKLDFIGDSHGEFRALVFFDEADLAERYATAINGVTIKPPAESEAA